MSLGKWIFYILILNWLFVNGCKSQKSGEAKIVFSMSDTMYHKCAYYKAEESDVKDEIRLFGKVTAENNKMAQVFPVMSGVVKSINVELGDYVKQNQLLASIQSSEVANFQKQKLDALNDVAIAEKNLQVARDLYLGKLNSEKDVTASERELDKARAELTRINEVYNIYQLKGGSIYNITSPISGFIVSKKINQNEQLRSDGSEPIFSVAEINEVWVLANVNESDISRVQVGYDVAIKTLAFPDTVYRGKIDKIFNAIDPATRSMKVRIKVGNADLKLKPEMNCTVSVSFSENKSLISIPSSAVIFDKNKYWVMVFKDKNNIDTRNVTVYRQLGDTTYLQTGIKAGETVISKNGLMIYDAIND
ncbi:MAG: efflux RND transporter periplasmic adaptor subunit [Chitinophagaceae bacterium]